MKLLAVLIFLALNSAVTTSVGEVVTANSNHVTIMIEAEEGLFTEPKLVERFLAKINKDGPLPDQNNPHYNGLSKCWQWSASHTRDGYGTFGVKGKMLGAHRVSYQVHGGNDPSDFCVCHRCDNKSCVNPEHLFLGSKKDNAQDSRKKGRTASGERHGLRLHPERVSQGENHYSRTNPEKMARGLSHGSKTKPERLATGDRHGSRTFPEKVCKGEKHKNSKLTEENVRQIRKIYEKGGMTYAKLAEAFGISFQTVGVIVTRKVWKHVI